MQANLVLEGKLVPVQLHRVRGNRLQLRVLDGVLHIQAPGSALTPEARAFIESKAQWVLRQIARTGHSASLRKQYQSQIDRHVQVFGHRLPVQFVGGPRFSYQLRADGLSIQVPPKARNLSAARIIKAALKRMAEQYLQRRTEEWAQHLGLRYNRLSIKDHRSKWGSCSSLRNLNLNWHLILLDKAMMDYVIVHELTHLTHMDHSPRFWQALEQALPGAQKLDRELNQHQWVIGLYEPPEK
jgi:predicted metal-dependent hydrolase